MSPSKHDDESAAGKVLLVGEYGAINGAENSLLAILPWLQAAGWTFESLVPADSDFSNQLRLLDMNSHHFDPGWGPTRKSQSEIREQIRRVMQTVRPSLLHANSLSAGRLCGPVTLATGTPSVGHLRDIVGLSAQAIADLNSSDRLIAVSTATREFHVRQGLDPTRVVVVHNGIDLHRFHPPSDEQDSIAFRAELNLPADSQLLLSVGQIGMRKGLDTVLEAFAALQQEYPRLHLCIVGVRHSQKAEAVVYEQQLQSRSASFPDRVHWLGRRTDIPQLMRGATLLLHAARQEPLGRVLLEACASGLPIVATHVGGTPEILAAPLGAHLTCPPDEPQQLATLLRPLLNSRQLRQQVGQQLRRIAEAKFSAERCAAAVEQIYEEAIRQKAEVRDD